MYARIDCILEIENSSRSPVLFVHGFPDSPLMFSDYFTSAEQQQDWLKGRSIYTYAFPNRHNNPNFPPLAELKNGVMNAEFDALLDGLAAKSPTGKLVIVCHDWGATHTWRWARSRKNPPIERLVALSVGSSIRYDVWEHGFGVITWFYGMWFGSSWYVKALRKPVASSIVSAAGYRSETAMELWRDAYHYWDRFSLLLTFLPQSFKLINYLPEYLDFQFPVLYMRSKLDRIASTAAFEKIVQSRPDCRFVLFEGYNHWFPEQHSDEVLAHIRKFL
jgi:pimeloyl-ACP methyl ester carboxylesterase